MGLFSKRELYLGVDIGAHNLKIVELENVHGRAKLSTYGFSDQVIEQPGAPEIWEDQKKAATLLRQVMRQAGATSHRVVAALPAEVVFSSVISIVSDGAPAKGAALDEQIRWEAKKVIPLPIEEMILYHNMLPTSLQQSGEGHTSRYLLTAASRDVVQKYLSIFQQASLQVVSLETEEFALVRSLVGSDPSAIMIVDFGEVTTGIAVVVGGIPVLARSIDTAGRTVDQLIGKTLGIDPVATERLKRDVSELGRAVEPQLWQTMFDALIHELRYCLNLYTQDNSGAAAVEKIILTGGSSALPHLDSYIEQQLGLKVFVGDPWARIVYPEELKPVLDGVGARLAVAVGLGLREIVRSE